MGRIKDKVVDEKARWNESMRELDKCRELDRQRKNGGR